MTESERIDERWRLTPAERALVLTKYRASRLGFAVLLTFFRERGRFPRDPSEIEAQGIAALSRQLDIPAPTADKAFFTGRTAERLRAEIRARFGFREGKVADAEQLEVRCRELAIEPPTPERMERIARSALRAHEDRFYASVYERLPPATRERLDALLYPEEVDADTEDAQDPSTDRTPRRLVKLRDDPGRPSLRIRSLTDDLVDLLIETIHKIGVRAERKVERDLLEDLKRVSGEQNLLFELADAALARSDGVVREVVFPVVGEQTLQDLVKERKARGPTYRVTLRTVIRNSYPGHFRRMVPALLALASKGHASSLGPAATHRSHAAQVKDLRRILIEALQAGSLERHSRCGHFASAGPAEHLGRMGACGCGDLGAAEHTRDLFDSLVAA